MPRKAEWDDGWIADNYLSYPTYREMIAEYNSIHGTSYTSSGIKAHARKLGLKKPHKYRRDFTEEQKAFLHEMYHTHSQRETLRLFNECFGTNYSRSTIKNYSHRHGLRIDEDVKNARRREDLDKPDSKRKQRSLGDVRMECGRWVMKTEDGWDQASRVIYREHHGEIPDGYSVIFLDNDKNNYSPENLAAVPKTYVGMLQANGMRSECAEITKTGICWCNLVAEIERSEAMQY